MPTINTPNNEYLPAKYRMDMPVKMSIECHIAQCKAEAILQLIDTLAIEGTVKGNIRDIE